MADLRSVILIALTDFPGLHYRIAEQMGTVLTSAGMRVAYLLTSPYMEHFKDVDLEAIGPVFRLSEMIDPSSGNHLWPEDHWWMHSSSVRQEYYRGRSLLRPQDYGPLRAAIECVIDRLDRVDLVWSEPPTSATLAVLHDVCSTRGIPYWGIGAARVPGHFQLSSDRMATQLLASGGVGVPHSLPEGVPDYHRRLPGHSGRGEPRRVIARVRQGALASVVRRSRSMEIGYGPIWQAAAVLRRLQRKVRWLVQQRLPGLFDRDQDCIPDPEMSPAGTFIFPLHVRPEASTSMWARFYEHDLQTLRNLAFSLPGGATLVVKEHPAAVGSRATAFYRALRRLPGVRLAGPGFPTADHLGRYTGVVVLTSTMGFEALQHGVPVLVLGRVFYEEYTGVERANGWDDVTRFYQRALGREIATHPSTVWQTYRMFCFPGVFDIFDPAVCDADNIARLVAPLLAYLSGIRP